VTAENPGRGETGAVGSGSLADKKKENKGEPVKKGVNLGATKTGKNCPSNAARGGKSGKS